MTLVKLGTAAPEHPTVQTPNWDGNMVGDKDEIHAAAAHRAHPGRPCALGHGNIADDLMRATASCLQQSSHLDLGLRTIAEKAGTSHTMIRYYFESKDGLLLALLDSFTGGLEADLKRLRIELPGLPGSPTWHLINCLVKGIFGQPEVMRVAVTEISRAGSTLGNQYLHRSAKRVYVVCRSIIQDLIARGLYKPMLDDRLATYMATGLVTLGINRLPQLHLLDMQPSEIASPTWVDFIANMLDSQFLNHAIPQATPI